MIHFNKITDMIGIVLLLMLLVLWGVAGIDRISNVALGFDEAYNAQVGINLLETGTYKVNYPSDQIFYNAVTTGPTMLLPLASVYAFWGVSNFSTGIIPFIYSCISLLFIFFLSYFLFKTYFFRLLIASFVTSAYVFSSTWFIPLSSTLLGEIASFAFTLLSILFLAISDRQKYKCRIFTQIAAGYFMAFSFVSKTSQIFMCLVALSLLLLRAIVNDKYKLANFCEYVLGFALGIITWDVYKVTQFGGFDGVVSWWVKEWYNMFQQTGTVGLFDGFTIDKITTRFLCLQQVIHEPYWIIVAFLVTPILLFPFYFYSSRKQFDYLSPVLFLGIMSDSLLIYFVFFGADGLTYNTRRMAVYGECLVCSNIIIIVSLFVSCVSNRFWLKLWGLGNYIILLSVAIYPTVCNNVKSLTNKCSMSDRYIAAHNISEYIKTLPSDSTFYGYGWWQAPEVSLLSQKKFKDITFYYSNLNNINFNNAYLVIGDIVYPSGAWNGDFDSYLNQLFNTKIVYKDPLYTEQERYIVYKLLGVNTNNHKVY